MLLLKVRIGTESFLIDTSQVVEVLPLLQVTPVPQAPIGVAGQFNYHGRAVPVVDLSVLMLGQPARRHISTRLVVTDVGEGLLGLIAEQATDVIRRDAGDFSEPGIGSDSAPYLGAATREGNSFLQRINLNRLLSESSRRLLFRQSEEGTWSSPELRPS